MSSYDGVEVVSGSTHATDILQYMTLHTVAQLDPIKVQRALDGLRRQLDGANRREEDAEILLSRIGRGPNSYPVREDLLTGLGRVAEFVSELEKENSAGKRWRQVALEMLKMIGVEDELGAVPPNAAQEFFRRAFNRKAEAIARHEQQSARHAEELAGYKTLFADLARFSPAAIGGYLCTVNPAEAISLLDRLRNFLAAVEPSPQPETVDG